MCAGLTSGVCVWRCVLLLGVIGMIRAPHRSGDSRLTHPGKGGQLTPSTPVPTPSVPLDLDPRPPHTSHHQRQEVRPPPCGFFGGRVDGRACRTAGMENAWAPRMASSTRGAEHVSAVHDASWACEPCVRAFRPNRKDPERPVKRLNPRFEGGREKPSVFTLTVSSTPFGSFSCSRRSKPRTDDKSNDHSLRLEGRSAPTRETNPFLLAQRSARHPFVVLASFLGHAISLSTFQSLCLHDVPLHFAA